MHIRNFSMKTALTKAFANVSTEGSSILVISSCLTNDEIYAKKSFVSPSRSNNKGKREYRRKERQFYNFLRYVLTQ